MVIGNRGRGKLSNNIKDVCRLTGLTMVQVARERKIELIVGEMNLSKSGEFGVTSFLSLWHMRSRVL